MGSPKFKVGDTIIILDSGMDTPDFFFDGDVGTIIKIDDCDNLKVDFSRHSNPNVIDDGIWWIDEDVKIDRVRSAPISE